MTNETQVDASRVIELMALQNADLARQLAVQTALAEKLSAERVELLARAEETADA